MDIHKISSNIDELNEFEWLYLKVFPEEERLDFKLLQEKEKEGKGNFLGLFDDGNDLVGMMYYSCYNGIVYIFYLGISPMHQSKGYGRMMLEYMFKEYNDYKIILLIEELDESAENISQRVRRKEFYLKNGFADNGQFLETLGLRFELIHRRGRVASVDDYKEIKSYYYSGLS